MHIRERRLAIVLIVSSLYGILFGVLQPFPQVAVEQGQVLAGIFQYPPDNPFFIYQTKTWTLLGQLSAIGLQFGFSEFTLSLFWLGLAGGLTYAGFALWSLALSDSVPFALLSTAFFVKMLQGYLWGFSYLISLLGTEHTYGLIGMAFIFFICGLFANGQRTWGWILAGLSPAIHPSLGTWLNLVLWLSLLSDFKNLRSAVLEGIKFSIPGYLLTLVSLAYQFIFFSLPALDPATTHRYMQAYLTYWDNHRHISWGLGFNIVNIGMFISLFWLVFKPKEITPQVQFLLRIYIATVAIASIAAAILYFNLPFAILDILWILLPTRFLNLTLIGYLPLLFGLFWSCRDRAWVSIVNALALISLTITFFLGGLAFFNTSIFQLGYEFYFKFLYFQLIAYGILLTVLVKKKNSPKESFIIFIIAVIAFAHFLSSVEMKLVPPVPATFISLGILATLYIAQQTTSQVISKVKQLNIAIQKPKTSVTLNFKSQALTSRSFIFATFILVTLWTLPRREDLNKLLSFADRYYQHPFRVSTKQSQGQIIMMGYECGITLNQLITHRPILDFMPINMLPYAIEGAPAMEKILRDIYELDFFSYPPSNLAEHVQKVWEKRSQTDWATLGIQYHATEIVAPNPWKIQLPYVTETNLCTMYRISAP